MFGLKIVFAASFALIVFGFFYLLIARETWMIYLFAGMYGISYGTFEVLQSPFVAELFGLTSIATVLGFLSAFGSVGFMLGPFMAGDIFDVTGSYNLPIIICGVLSVVTIIIIMCLRDLKKPLEGT